MRLERELNYSGTLQTERGFQLPTWALILIIIIVVIIVLSIILFFVIRYRKKKSKKSQAACQKSNLPSRQNTMLAIWSSPQESASCTQITNNIFEFSNTRHTNISSSSIIAWDITQQQTHKYINSQRSHNSEDTSEETLAGTVQNYDGGKSVTYI
jgi:cytoskeletal protein RodZ